MIISHKYRFIFIKTKKTAGTSLEVFLSQACGADDVVTPITPAVLPHRPRNYAGYFNPVPELLENKGVGSVRLIKDGVRGRKFYNHMPASVLRHRVPEKIWNSYFKFCVDRNPWDKTISHYYMTKARNRRNMSLTEYFERNKLCQNYPLYCDRRQGVIVDQVLKYESLNSQLSEVFHALGVPFSGTLTERAKSEYRTDKRSYRQILSPDQRDHISKAFSFEISNNGYSY